MDEDREFALESRLTNHGCYLREAAVDDDGYHVTYQSAAADANGEIPHQQVGDVVNDFRKLFDRRDWPVRSVEATVTDLDDDPLGSWRAERSWFVALADGDLTEVEFSERLLDSLETVER